MRCEAKTQKGERCKAPALKNDTRCFHHSDRTAAERQEARRRGGLRLHHGAGGGQRVEFEIQEVADVLNLLSTAASDLLSRPPSTSRARALAYVSSSALKALEVGSLEERVAALESRLKLERAS